MSDRKRLRCGAIGDGGRPCVRDMGHAPGINHMDAKGYPWPAEPVREVDPVEPQDGTSVRAPYQRTYCTECPETFLPKFHVWPVLERDATHKHPEGMMVHRSRTRPCGPVVTETVGIQEQFAEWCEQGI